MFVELALDSKDFFLVLVKIKFVEMSGKVKIVLIFKFFFFKFLVF